MKFSEIIGNNSIKEYLKEQACNNMLVHSYLFSGIESIGKFEIAKEFSKMILCVGNKQDNCSCTSCVKYASFNHPDFFIINQEEQVIKIEQIRELASKILEKPILSDKKIYIINQAHKMTKEAQNCLLKTLEEPPEFAIIILITSNESMLLSTIKSRCMKINFMPISDDEMLKYCKNILGYTNISENTVKSFSGSIGKAIEYKENREIYQKIEEIVDNFEKYDILELLEKSKFLYNKDMIQKYLEYMISYMYSKIDNNLQFLNCINIINSTINKIKSNVNLDMNLDMMLIKIWEEFE